MKNSEESQSNQFSNQAQGQKSNVSSTFSPVSNFTRGI